MASELRFCTVCAGELKVQSAGHPASPHPVCQQCGFVLWQNPKPSVAALITRGEGAETEILLGRLAEGPGSGHWDTPGGFLNVGDEPIDTLIRECRREYDVDVEVGALIGAFTDDVFGSELALFYRCKLKPSDPRPADIVDAVEWFSVFAPPTIAYRSVDQAVRTLADLIRSS